MSYERKKIWKDARYSAQQARNNRIIFNFKTLIPAGGPENLSQPELEFDKMINKKMVMVK